jgi:acyl-CoA thioester hydrolase
MREYIRRFRVRHYELDSFNHVNHAVYANYMQEAAIEASSDLGFTPHWYRENKTAWVVRKLSIRYHQQTTYQDELEVRTWISDVRRASSHREYLITRVKDGAKVARGRANWVYVNRETMQPIRIPDFFQEAFMPTNKIEELGIRIENATPIHDAFRYITRRRVHLREIDGAGHVNHTVYLSWIEQAYFDALRTAGHPVEKTREEGWFAFQGGHELEYFAPAFDNDEIEIVSHICEMGKVRGSWTHEVYNSKTKKLLARDYSLGVFVNDKGRLIPAPMHIVGDVLRGHKV